MANSPAECDGLTSRSFLRMVDLWLVAAAGIILVRVLQGTNENLVPRLLWLATFLIVVRRFGRLGVVRRFISTMLRGDSPANVRLMTSVEELVGDTASPSVGIESRPILSRQILVGLRRHDWRWALAGFGLVAFLLFVLERRQSYFFVQDDNLSQFMPVVLHGCRSVFNEGLFSTWNAHQFLGSPTASLGTYALTYPFTYAAYAVARFALHDEFATFDVFCIGHLLAGYVAMFWACRVIGIRSVLSAAAAVCFAFSGYFLIAGRSWYYMTPLATYAPLLMGLLEIFRRGHVGWKWVLATATVFGLLFHAGNAQMWCYAGLFFAIGVGILLFCRAVPWLQAIPALSALAIGAAVAMPLLVPQYLETAALPRTANDHAVMRVLPIFLPDPLYQTDFAALPGNPHNNHLGYMQYSGMVFNWIAGLGMMSLLAYRWSRQTVAANLWIILAAIALLLGIGNQGVLWYLVAKVPPFTGFTQSKKFIPLVSLFMLAGGALLLERGLQRWKHSTGRSYRLAALAVTLVTYHAWLPIPSFCDYGFQPYPNLPAEIASLQDNEPQARVYSVSPLRSLSPQFAFTMAHQLPTVWGWQGFEGYDPLVSKNPLFNTVMNRLRKVEYSDSQITMAIDKTAALIDSILEFSRNSKLAVAKLVAQKWCHPHAALNELQAYGVRWIVIFTGPQVPKNSPHLFWQMESWDIGIEREAREQGRLVAQVPGIEVYELNHSAPLAFAAQKPHSALPIKFSASGFVVDTSNVSDSGEIVINVLQAPWLKVKADNVALESRADSKGRLLLQIPPGTQQVSAVYSPPWKLGCLAGIALTIAAGLAMQFRPRRSAQVVQYPTGDSVRIEMLRRRAG